MKVIILSIILMLQTVTAQNKYPPLKIGAAAPEFNLKGVDGKMHSLKDYKAKVLAIVFNCNHCPTCLLYTSPSPRDS